MRDRDHSETKPAGTLRIAVLGDSYAEAMQVNLPETFWHIAEQRLSRCPKLRQRKIEFLNFGVSGYGTGQQLLTLRHKVWRYQPDIVLVAFLTGNDFSDNVLELKGIPYHPYFEEVDGALELQEDFVNTREYRRRAGLLARLFSFSMQYSRILQLINKMRYARKVQAQKARRQDHAELGLSRAIYRPPQTPEWKKAWKISEMLLQTMHTETVARNAQLRVVTLSNAEQVLPDPAATEHLQSQLGISDLFYPDRRIAELGKQVGFPVLNLAPMLQDYAKNSGEYVHGFGQQLGHGHWNQRGHAQAGRRIADWLCAD